MLGPLSQCSTCTRMRSWIETGQRTSSCEAFPGGIPDAVWTNTLDHRQPVPGDHGLRWESDGQPFPGWALPETADSAPDDEDEYAAA
jgi:hypothetical protein